MNRDDNIKKIEELLGHPVQKMARGAHWSTSSFSLTDLTKIMGFPKVKDVRVGIVGDTDESWDGEPYDSKFEIKVLLHSEEE